MRAAAQQLHAGGPGGLDAGQANDPLFCNEPLGPYYSEQWNNFCFLPQTQAMPVMAGAPNAPRSSGTCNTGAWNLGAQGQGTVIAILDSGVNYYHQDLQNQMVDASNNPELSDPDFPGAIHGWNFYDDNADPMDYFGHGSGRAGLAAAEAGNGVGMAGASPRSLLMAVKVGDTYVVHSENLAQGVVYAADHGADVINTSLGATGNSKLLRAAATYAYSKGVFWAAATANEYSTHHNYPTNLDTVAGAGGLGPELADPTIQTCQSVNSAGATNCAPAQPQTTFLQKVNYANYGGIQTFAAPIDTVGTSLSDTAYGLHQSGTSTATPHLAAAGAIVRSAGFHAAFAAETPTSAARSPRWGVTRRPHPRRSARTRFASCLPTRRRASTTTTRRARPTTTRPTRQAIRPWRAASTTRSRAGTRTADGTSGPGSAAPTSTPLPRTPSRA